MECTTNIVLVVVESFDEKLFKYSARDLLWHLDNLKGKLWSGHNDLSESSIAMFFV